MTQLYLSLAYTTGSDNCSLPPLYLTGITPYYILNLIPIPDRCSYTPHQRTLFKGNGNSHWTQHRWCTGSPDITTPVKEGQEDCKSQNTTRKTAVNQSLLEVAAQIKPNNDNTNKHANMEEGNFQRIEPTPDKELQETNDC